MRLAAMAASALALAAVLGGGRAAHAGAAEQLGDAYRAYDAGDVDEAARLLEGLSEKDLVNDDYLHWLRGQVALLRGEPRAALEAFEDLGRDGSSRFGRVVAWRIADCRWELGEKAAAAAAYRKLLGGDGAGRFADLAVVRMRIAEVASGKAQQAALREVVIEHPRHPAADRALRQLEAAKAGALTPDDRITRAQNLVTQHLWDEAVAELMLIPEKVPPGVWTRRTYWLGTTLFKMRRRYADAGKLLLSVYDEMDSAEAMFHGARALSRADRDDEAIAWYRKVVARYPGSVYAKEAQYLSGWLEFNRGDFEKAIPGLEEMLRRYPDSKWTDDALWFLGMSRFLLGQHRAAMPTFERLAARGGAYEGGKGRYWLARTRELTGDVKRAEEGYRALVARYPFTWYALLARARLAERGVDIGPFGVDAPAQRGPRIATTPSAAIARDALIAGADELIAAGLDLEAGEELERGEKAFLGRHDRPAAFAVLLDRYAKSRNHHRPWMLAIVHAEEALDGPAEGAARVWWEYAYPQAFRELVEKYQHVGGNPDYYLYSIMRKESGFDPHVLSYADAQGLLQMIPATTKRVARELGLPYDPGRLYDPAFNIQTASWYIGTVLAKFKGQIPLGAASFNAGPRPVMKWLTVHGDRPMDELVELVAYTQTREYMKKVTENYARYVYLYEQRVYEQPLAVDKAYRVDDITY